MGWNLTDSQKALYGVYKQFIEQGASHKDIQIEYCGSLVRIQPLPLF